MPNLRKQPFIYVTWLRNYLIGEDLCRWSIWHRIFYHFEKAKSDFDSVKHDMEHTALLNITRKRYIAEGFQVYQELTITVNGKVAVLKGKIDLVAVKEDKKLIIEVKTGTPRKADQIQTMLYIWALPRTYSKFRGMSFEGLVVYPSHEIEISALSVDEQFVRNFERFTKDIMSEEPDRKYPSPRECSWCKIANCDERDGAEDFTPNNEYVSDFF